MTTPSLHIERRGVGTETASTHVPTEGMVWIPGGSFQMGSNDHYPEESPVHRVSVGAFWMDRFAVTNAEFAEFVADTGHVTLAEKVPEAADYPGALEEMLRPSSMVFERPTHPPDMRDPYSWWRFVAGACWREPRGPGSTWEELTDHPVVHLAYDDAAAYAQWVGKDLPTEAEWEFAARGGLDRAEYAWGDELAPGGRIMANTWQGSFPEENLLADGYEWTAPVGSFPPNGYGLYDMIGNVWEWTSDWYEEHSKHGGSCCGSVNPRGGTREDSIDARTPEIRIPRKVMKGGSFLCASNYCRRYRPAARMSQPIDTSTCHVGFRCIVRPA